MILVANTHANVLIHQVAEVPRDIFGKLRERLQGIQTLDPGVRGGVAQHIVDLGDRG